MRLSESLRRGIMETSVGGIINKFKIKRRRVTLFFEDILAEYIKECEDAGYGEEMLQIGEKWSMLNAEILIPSAIKKLPLPLFAKVVKAVWTSIGIVEDIEIKRENNKILLNTKKESITRIIGENNFAEGCFRGMLSVYLNSVLIPVNVLQNKNEGRYVYNISDKHIVVKGKSKERYDILNSIDYSKGCTLKDAIKANIFQLSGNRLSFRGRTLCYSENTIFHLFSNSAILFENIPKITYKYFGELVEKGATKEKKLLLLKTLLQAMGWGIVKIKMDDKDSITIEISDLSCGLQLDKENWDFLAMIILGYILTIDTHFTIMKKEFGQRNMRLYIVTSRHI